MRKHINRFVFISGLIVAVILSSPNPVSYAQSGDQAQVVELINGLRASLGLYAYQYDPVLSLAAQRHSEWAASVGTHSHTGPGGSTPRDRAAAVGYGGGAQIWVWENIYWGGSATPQCAFTWWSNSDIHYQGMTHTNYTHIGVGVAYDESGAGYFTVLFGRIGNQPPPQSSTSSGSSTEVDPAEFVNPVEVAEPAEDGSIQHEVQQGQALWLIADAYDIPLSELLALNRLTENSVIQPGDILIIQPSPISAETEPVGPIVHVVQAGQTPMGIALAYGISLDELYEYNDLVEGALIFPGDELIVRPGEEATSDDEEAVAESVVESLPTVETASGTEAFSPEQPSESAETDSTVEMEAGIDSSTNSLSRRLLTLIFILVALVGFGLMAYAIGVGEPSSE